MSCELTVVSKFEIKSMEFNFMLSVLCWMRQCLFFAINIAWNSFLISKVFFFVCHLSIIRKKNHEFYRRRFQLPPTTLSIKNTSLYTLFYYVCPLSFPFYDTANFYSHALTHPHLVPFIRLLFSFILNFQTKPFCLTIRKW